MQHANDANDVLAVDRLAEKSAKVAVGLGAVAGAVLMVQVCVDVLGRNLFNKPLPGTPEFVAYWWLPAIIFLPVAFAHRLNEHLDVTIATATATGFAKRVGVMFKHLVLLIILVLVTYFSYKAAVHGMSIDQSIVADLRLIIWPGKFVMAIGLTVWAVQVAIDLVAAIRDEVRIVRSLKQEQAA